MTVSIDENSVEIDKPFNITLKLTDRDGNPLVGEHINVSIKGVTVDLSDKVTNASGIIVFEHTVHDGQSLTIDATFEGNSIYDVNSTRYTYPYDIDLLRCIIDVKVDYEPIFINDTIIISGSLNDSFDGDYNQQHWTAYTRPISGATVDIYINKTLIGSNVTDSNGHYSFVLTNDDEHNEFLKYSETPYEVRVNYIGLLGIFGGNSASTPYSVTKIVTKTNVTVLNHTVGNIVISVNVTNMSDQNVVKGNITIYDRNNQTIANGTLVDGTVNLTIPSEQSGPLEIVVTYNENDIYYSSNAINESMIGSVYENIFIITVVNRNATIDIALSESEILFDKHTTISGHVYDDDGTEITQGNVTITINGEETTVDLTSLGYELNYTATQIGNFTINATYNGKLNVINPVTSSNVTLNSTKHPVVIRPSQNLDNDGKRILIVEVNDRNGTIVPNGTVILTLPDGTNVTSEIVDGITQFMIDIQQDEIINITYNGTDLYDKGVTRIIIKDSKIDTIIELSLSDNKSTYFVAPGDKVNITVVLKDEGGHPLDHKNVTVTLTDVNDNNKYLGSMTNVTDTNGKFVFEWIPTIQTTYRITANFDGSMDVLYNSASNSTTLEVHKIGTLARIFNQTEYRKDKNITFEGWLFYKDINNNDINICGENVSITMFYQNGTSETKIFTTNETGRFIFNFTKENADDNFTIGFDYPGSYRYISYNFNKLFDDKVLTYSDWVYQKLVVKINETNDLTFTVEDVNGVKLNGTFSIYDENNTFVANVTVTDGVGVYHFRNSTAGEIYLTGIFTNNTSEVQYNRVSESITFYVVKLDDVISIEEVLNNTVFNTTLKINVTNPYNESSIVEDGEVIVYKMNEHNQKDIEIGRGNLVDGKVIIELHDVNMEGTYPIIITYGGNDYFLANQTTGSVTVNKLNTSVEVIVSNINYTQMESINITINETTATGNVTVYVNSTLSGFTNRTETIILTGNQAQLNLTDLDVGEYNVTVIYNGDDNHNGNTTNVTFTVNRLADYTINVTVNNITYGEKSTIDITVPYDAEGIVLVNITGTDIIDREVPINNGHAILVLDEYALEVNEYEIKVVFNDSRYAAQTNNTLFNVSKALPNIVISPTNISYGYNESVKINLTSYNASGKVNITVFNESGIIYTNTSVTINNNTAIECIVVNNLLDVGNFTVKVEYYDDNNYNSTVFTEDFEVRRPDISIVLDKDNIFITEDITILGGVSDGLGTVNITVYDSEGNLYRNYTADVNTLKLYYANKAFYENGTYKVNATYILNGMKVANSKTIEFNVTKIPTITNVTIVNTTAGNVIIDVVVRENATGHTGIIENGTIKITVGSNSEEYNITGVTTRITLNATVNITSTDEVALHIEYLENNKYLNSTGINSTSGKIISKFNATARMSNVTIEISSPSYVTENVTVSGQVFDETGKVIEEGTVTIEIDGEDPITVEFTNGRYEGNITVNTITGYESQDFNVKVTYLGNKTSAGNYVVLSSTNTSTCTIMKIPTVTNVTLLNNTYGNVTIRVNATDARNASKLVTTGTVYVLDIIHSKLLTTEGIDVSGGNVDIKLNIDSADITKLYIYYEINPKYQPSNARNESTWYSFDKDVYRIDVQKAPSTTNIEDVLSTKSGNVTLAINVTNSTDDLISTGHVVVVNATDGSILGEGDLVSGKVNITLGSVVEPGNIVVNVTYQGNDLYLESNITSYQITVTVDPSINITLSDEEVIIGEPVTITGYVLNTTRQPYTTGRVNVTVDGVNITGVTYDPLTGQYSVTFTPSYEGVLTVNATFIGDDDTVIVISENKSLTVNKIPTITSVEVLNSTYSNVTIRVSVVGENDPDTNLTVGNITVYDMNGNLLAFEKELTQDGYVDIVLNNITATGQLKIKVTYNENDIYLTSNALNESAYDPNYITLNIGKIPTITSIYQIINNSVSNVTLKIQVTNATGESLTNGRIEVRNATGALIGEGSLDDEGKAIITLTKTFSAGEIQVNVTYMGDDYYYSSNVTCNIRVYDSNIISIELDTDNVIIGENVTVKVNVTNDLGVQITDAAVNVTINGSNYTATYNSTSGFHEVQYNAVSAGKFLVNATYIKDNVTSITLEFTVNKIPTSTNVTVINSTVSNVTLNITVKDKYDNIIKEGKVNITIAGNNPIEIELSGNEYTIIHLLDNITSTGNISVKVEYAGNDTYLPSVANNTADNSILKNITVTPRNSTLTVTITPITTVIGNNITISGELADENGNKITDADLVIYVDGIGYSAKTNNTGGYSINYTTRKVAENIIVNTTFNGNNNYNPTNANTSFNVTKIATKTNVTILNTTIGKVIIHVNVTNLTNNPVERGHVIVRNQTGEIIGEGELINGGVDITLNINTIGNVKVNVTYEANEIYYGSNGRNSSISDDDPEVNITNINVVKQEANISIALNPETLMVGENVYIHGTVMVDNEFIKTGQVNITVNGENITVNINSDGSYNLTYKAPNAGEYTVNATYLGNESINSATTANNAVFTVNKMTTNTTVTILNNTIGHVEIEVTVTDKTGSPIKGKINVTFANGTSIIKELAIDGKINVTIPSTTMNTLEVNVTYLENENYYSSVAINTTEGVSPDKINTTQISIDKIDSIISVDLDTTDLIIGQSVTITVNITDADGKQITDKNNVIIYINGVEIPNKDDIQIVDGKLTVQNVTVTSGTFTVNATYKGNTTVNAANSNSIQYTVNKIATTTNVSIINSTARNVTLDITVKGNDGNISMTGKVNITIDGKTLQVDLDGNENIIVALKDNITRSGNINVTVVFDGNELYQPSDATINDKILENITVSNITALLTVDVDENTIINGSNVTIYGTLTDDMGRNITDAYVSIYVNGKRIDTIETNSTGGYNITYTTDTVGPIEVNVIYKGDNIRYANATDYTTFDVLKLNSSVSVEVGNIIYGDVESVNITINESDATGYVTVYINSTLEGFENITKVLTLSDAIAQLNLNSLKAGKYNVTVIYDGNSKYNGNKTSAEFIVERLADYTVNVETVNITYGDDERITVTLPSDATGSVSISIDGISIDVDTKELSDGVAEFIIPRYTGIVAGKYTVKVSYSGDENYEAKDDVETEFIVTKAESHITITADNVKTGSEANVTLNIGDHNATGKAVVTVYDSDNQLVKEVPVDSLSYGENVTVSLGKLEAGTYTVNVTYYDDKNYNNSKSSVAFNVSKTATATAITVLNRTTGNVTIEVTVNDESGNAVNTGNITVEFENGTFIENKTLIEGKVNVTIPSDNTQTLNINVTYNENEYYDESEASTEITVDKQKATISIELSAENLTVGDSINVTGIVRDEMGNIVKKNVIVTIAGTDYPVTFLENGTFIVTNKTLTAGTFVVNASFNGNEYLESVSSENLTFTVNTITTKTVVQIVNTTVDNVTIDIVVTDNYGNILDSGELEIIVAGKSTTKTITGNTTRVKLDIDDVGDIAVTVKYLENSIYSNSTGIINNTISSEEILENITTTKKLATITVNATPNTVNVGQIVKITGKLTDEMNNIISDAYVEITVNGDKYITTTDSNGKYELTNITVEEGKVNVVATYKGNKTVNATTAFTNYDVNKISTITIVSITNTTVGNVSIDVVVKDKNGNIVSSGKLNISTEDSDFTVEISGQTTSIPLNYTSYGTKTVHVEYLGNDVYINSTGLDKVSYDKDPENAEIFNNITVTRLNTTITVNATSPVKAGNSTIISGRLVDEQNRPISNANVVVIIDKEYNVTTDANGEYLLVYNSTIVGTHNVRSIYDSNECFIGTYDITIFKVEKVNAILSVDSIEDITVGDNVNITGKLKDEFGNPINNTKLNVTFDGKTQTVTTDNEGNFNTTFQTNSTGNKEVLIEFNGNDKYNKTSATDTVNIEDIKASISINTPEDIKIDESTNISGKITDENGNAIPNIPVNITVNGKTYTTTTDKNGNYNIPINNTVTGQNNVTVTTGNDSIEKVSANDKFFINKEDTTLTINPINDTQSGENVTITGKLTTKDGKAIANAEITVNMDGINQTVTTDKNGNYKATFPTDTTGTKLVIVTYEGDENYNKATPAETFEVYKETANIIIKVPENTVAGEPVNITGTITDEKGNPIPNIPVNVTVNGKTYNGVADENGTFTVEVDNIVSGKNNITVSGGNSDIEVTPENSTFDARKQKDVISIVNITDTPVGKDVTVSGQLLDENGNPISNEEVTVVFDGSRRLVKTNSRGYYEASFETTDVGNKVVKVEYAGNDIYDSANEDTKVNVVPNNGSISLKLPSDATVDKTTSINGTITDQDGKAVANTPVNVTVNGKLYQTVTDANGEFSILVDNLVSGTNNVTVTAGNELIKVKPVNTKLNALKQDCILTVDPIKESKIGDNVSITGKLTNDEGDPMKSAVVSIDINGNKYQAITDNQGNYQLTVSSTKVGSNNVTVSYSNDKYNPINTTTSFEVIKKKITVTVDSLNGIVGEDITLVAHLTDENGNLVNSGNIVFKINGKTLRVDNRFDSDDMTVKKFNVTNGLVTFTMKAYNGLCGAVNITASYSGSYPYESAQSNVADANISKRTALIEVKVSNDSTKQDRDIVFTAIITDVTKNYTNTTCLTTNASLVFKVNGVTIKNDDGSPLIIPVTSPLVTYVYHVPSGMAGLDSDGNIRNYTVEAVYANKLYTPRVSNTTVFHVERSVVNVNFKSTTVNNNVLSIDATLTDYEDKYLVGTNKICVKINGKTYQEGGKTKYFYVKDGIVDITDIKIDSGTDVKSVTLVTGDRQAYESARVTTTDIKVT